MTSQKIFMPSITLYGAHLSYDDMMKQIQNYSITSQIPLKLLLFTSTYNIFDYFTTQTYDEFKIKQIHFSNNICTGELSRNYGRKVNKSIKGYFLLFKHNKYDIYIIISDENTTFFENGILRYLSIHYPKISFPFFYSREMEEMLDNLSKARPDDKIMLTKISKKSRIRSNSARKSKESDITWTDLPYKDVFDEIRETDSWVQKVYFDLIPKNNKSKKNKVLSGYLSRNGVFKCEKSFELFYNTIIKTSIDIFLEKKNKLSNRARTKDNHYQSKPLFIEFDYPIFKDKIQNKRLINILKNLSHVANSVIHENPYLHLTLTDYIDNSNFEIWILSDNRITIVPQTICSMSSLNRLCDHITKEFREGIIKDFQEIS